MKKINLANPPQESLNELQKGIELAGNHNDKLLSESISKAIESPPDSTPHPCYTASLEALAAGISSSDLKLTGWRYLLSLDESFASIEVHLKDDVHNLGEINFGPFPQVTNKILSDEKRLDLLGDNDYELRSLRIPALFTFVLWFHGKTNLFHALEPVHQSLNTDGFYKEEEFFQTLQKMADEQIKINKQLDD